MVAADAATDRPHWAMGVPVGFGEILSQTDKPKPSAAADESVVVADGGKRHVSETGCAQSARDVRLTPRDVLDASVSSKPWRRAGLM